MSTKKAQNRWPHASDGKGHLSATGKPDRVVTLGVGNDKPTTPVANNGLQGGIQTTATEGQFKAPWRTADSKTDFSRAGGDQRIARSKKTGMPYDAASATRRIAGRYDE